MLFSPRGIKSTVHPPLAPRQQQVPLFHMLCFTDEVQFHQLAPFPFYLLKHRSSKQLSPGCLNEPNMVLPRKQHGVDKMQGHHIKHLASYSNCEAPHNVFHSHPHPETRCEGQTFPKLRRSTAASYYCSEKTRQWCWLIDQGREATVFTVVHSIHLYPKLPQR